VPDPAPPTFGLQGVSLRRDGYRILEAVDWTVREGERRVVLGPNGAGKRQPWSAS
jgi:ABC-type molybdenum transport system ATPase subunit/photorepair protein PhrA